MTFTKKLTAAIAATLLALSGTACDSSTTQDEQGRELTIVEPVDQTIAQGDTNDVLITIARDGFEGAVEIEFDGLPEGVELVQDKAMVKADDLTTTLTLKAESDAPIVDGKLVTVTASWEDLEVSQQFKVSVKNDS